MGKIRWGRDRAAEKGVNIGQKRELVRFHRYQTSSLAVNNRLRSVTLRVEGAHGNHLALQNQIFQHLAG